MARVLAAIAGRQRSLRDPRASRPKTLDGARVGQNDVRTVVVLCHIVVVTARRPLSAPMPLPLLHRTAVLKCLTYITLRDRLTIMNDGVLYRVLCGTRKVCIA